MKQRDNVIGRSMPRKSQQGTKVARWGTHQEMKAARRSRKWSKAK